MGFVLARHGLTRNITVQGIAQRDRSKTTAVVAGVRASLSPYWSVATDIADRDGSFGTFTEVFGRSFDWEFQLRSRYTERDYDPGIEREGAYRDSSLRTFYSVTPAWRLGIIGRDFNTVCSSR